MIKKQNPEEQEKQNVIPVEEQLARRQSAPRPTAMEEAQRMSQTQSAGQEALDGFKALAQVIGKEQIHEARMTLQKYKAGKANLEQKVIDSEQWYKLRNWECMRKAQKGKTDQVEPVSGWLFNAIANKHAAAMDNFPCPNILPREEGDKGEAQMLTSIVPVILDQNNFEETYDTEVDDKLKSGTGIYGVFWDAGKLNGLGDIAVEPEDVLNLFWEPGITDIQQSRNLFHVALRDNDLLIGEYPQLEGKLGSSALDISQYLYDDNVDTMEKSAVVDWYYKKRQGNKTVLHYCKFVNDEVLFATENEQEYAERGWYDHGMYPYVFDPLFRMKGTPCGFGFVDVAKSAQEYIDRGNQAILQNKYAAIGAVTGEDVSDREQLYQAYLDGDKEHLARVRSRYDGEDSYNAAMRTAIKEHFLAEDIDETLAAKYLVKYGGQDGSEAHWTVDEWKYAKENGTSNGYGMYNKFYTAVRTGEDLKTVIQEYTDNGVSEYTLSRQITTYFKPMYVRLSTVDRSNIKGYLLNALEFCGVERDAAMERIGDWDFEAQYGFAYDDRKQAYMDCQVSAADLRKILVKEGGYTAEDAAAQVEVYDWNKLGYDATVSNVKKYNTYCKPAGVPKDAYLQIVDFSNNTKNDVDEDGNTIHYSAVKKIMKRIDQLSITDNQKTAIALSLWKESTVEKYKLW